MGGKNGKEAEGFPEVVSSALVERVWEKYQNDPKNTSITPSQARKYLKKLAKQTQLEIDSQLMDQLLQECSSKEKGEEEKKEEEMFDFEKFRELVARYVAQFDIPLTASLQIEIDDIHVAVKKGDIEEIKSILSTYPIQINWLDKNGDTPLICAVRSGSAEVVSLLFTYNPSPTLLNLEGDSPLIVAVQENFNHILSLILNYYEQKTETKRKESKFSSMIIREVSKNLQKKKSLVIAAKNGNTEGVKLLLKHGCPADPFANIETPLSFATRHVHPEVVELLLQAGANPNACPKQGMTPLQISAEKSNFLDHRGPIVDSLLIHGADPLLLYEGKTPLIMAASLGNAWMIEHLLEHSPQIVNIPSDEGKTALHYAADNGYSKVVKKLLRYHADVHATTQKGDTALHFVTYVRCLGRGASAYKQMAKTLIQGGADLHAPLEDGSTPLHTAATLSELINTELIELFLNSGADINILNKKGETPLHVAAKNGCLSVALKLLEKGARADLQNEVRFLVFFGDYSFSSQKQMGEVPEETARANGHFGTAVLMERFHKREKAK